MLKESAFIGAMSVSWWWEEWASARSIANDLIKCCQLVHLILDAPTRAHLIHPKK